MYDIFIFARQLLTSLTLTVVIGAVTRRKLVANSST